MRSASLFFFRTVQSFLGSRSNGSVLIVKIGTARMAVRHLLGYEMGSVLRANRKMSNKI